MDIIIQARTYVLNDPQGSPNMAGLASFFAGLSDADIISCANGLIGCLGQLGPTEHALFSQFVLSETTKRALSA